MSPPMYCVELLHFLCALFNIHPYIQCLFVASAFPLWRSAHACVLGVVSRTVPAIRSFAASCAYICTTSARTPLTSSRERDDGGARTWMTLMRLFGALFEISSQYKGSSQWCRIPGTHPHWDNAIAVLQTSPGKLATSH